MIKIGISADAIPKALSKLAPLGLFDDEDVYILVTTLDEITKQDILEEGIRGMVLQYNTSLTDRCKVHVNIFRGSNSSFSVAQFCRDEGVQLFISTNSSFLSAVSPDTTVLVIK